MARRRARRRRRPRRKAMTVPRNKFTSPVVSMKFRLNDWLWTDGTGKLKGHINVNSLTNAYQPGDTNAIPRPLLDVQNAIALFDMYRVRAVKIEATPLFAQTDYVNQATAAGSVLTPMPNNALCYDVDNVGTLPSFSDIITRDRKHMFSTFRKLKHYQPVIKGKQINTGPNGGNAFFLKGGWNNLQNEKTNTQGIIDIQSDIAYTTDGSGGVETYADSRLMNLIVTYYVQFKFRQ